MLPSRSDAYAQSLIHDVSVSQLGQLPAHLIRGGDHRRVVGLRDLGPMPAGEPRRKRKRYTSLRRGDGVEGISANRGQPRVNTFHHPEKLLRADEDDEAP